MGRNRLDLSDLGQGPVVGSCEHGNEPSVSVKSGVIYLRFTNDCTP
jgi:hypothetical protein